MWNITTDTLAFKGYSWYVNGFCRVREGAMLWEASSGGGGPQVELVMKFTPRVRVEDFFDAEYIDVLEYGYALVRVRYPEDDWVYELRRGCGSAGTGAYTANHPGEGREERPNI